jgi:AcrR family transcriptional regulator
MAEVARRAGVGSATLYRNFPSRPDLLTALYEHEVDQLCRAAGETTGETPGAALQTWLRRFHTYFVSKGRVAAELLRHRSSDDPVFETGYSRVMTAGRPLLLAAQAAGEARRDVDLGQILDLVASVARIPGDDAYREPILRAALDGIGLTTPHRPTA